MFPSKYTFPALFEPEADGSYSVSFPDLDGCFTQGDTYDTAYFNAVDALSLHLYGMEEDGDTIPAPSIPAPCADALNVMVTAWMPPFREAMRNQSVKKTLTIPAWLNVEAERHNVNFSKLLQSALKDYLRQYD